MGASSQVAFAIAEKVESRLYDGISTQMIHRMIIRFWENTNLKLGIFLI
jgi:hypothetical protein